MKHTNHKLLALLLALVAITALCAFTSSASGEIVAQGSCGAQGDNVTYTIDIEGYTVVSGTGAVADYEVGERPWDHFSSEVNALFSNGTLTTLDVVIEEGVTSIGKNAFAYTPFETVSLPSTMVSIGDYAFYKCGYLENINLPEGLTSIGMQAFSGCLSLEEITIPSTLVSAPFAFVAGGEFGESNLKHVVFSDGLQIIDSGMFAGTDIEEITIPNSVEHIKSFAFVSDTQTLKRIRLGTGLKFIGVSAFNPQGAEWNLEDTPEMQVLTCMTEDTFLSIDLDYYTQEENDFFLSFGSLPLDEFVNDQQLTSFPSSASFVYNAHVGGEAALESHAATCTEDGHDYMVSLCTLCGREASRELIETHPAPGHDETGTPVEENLVSPDCTHSGSYDLVLYCKACGDEITREHTVLPALGHNNSTFWNWATDGSAATLIAVCSRCQEGQTIEATVSVSTAEDGSKTCFAVASLHDELVTDTLIIPATGPVLHNHQVEAVTWAWTADGTEAAAIGICTLCSQPVAAAASVQVETHADGSKTCYATAEIGGQTFQGTNTIPSPDNNSGENKQQNTNKGNFFQTFLRFLTNLFRQLTAMLKK